MYDADGNPVEQGPHPDELRKREAHSNSARRRARRVPVLGPKDLDIEAQNRETFGDYGPGPSLNESIANNIQGKNNNVGRTAFFAESELGALHGKFFSDWEADFDSRMGQLGEVQRKVNLGQLSPNMLGFEYQTLGIDTMRKKLDSIVSLINNANNWDVDSDEVFEYHRQRGMERFGIGSQLGEYTRAARVPAEERTLNRHVANIEKFRKAEASGMGPTELGRLRRFLRIDQDGELFAAQWAMSQSMYNGQNFFDPDTQLLSGDYKESAAQHVEEVLRDRERNRQEEVARRGASKQGSKSQGSGRTSCS